MSNGYTFTQFMQAALGPDPRDPRFYQQPPPPPPPHSGGSSLSALAPAFNPGVPPPNMLPPQGHQNVPQQFYQMNTPSARKHQSSGDARVHFQGSQDFLPQPDMGSEDSGQFQQHPSHRGNFSFHRGGRGRARGQGVHRGRGGFGQGQNQYQYSNRGYHSQSQSQNFPNSSGNKPRQQQHSRARERHSKDDNGDLLYSHADLNAAQNSQGGGGNQESNDARQRNTYVRPVNQYNSRVNGHPHSQNGARNESARGGRRGYRGDHEDRTTPPDSDKQGSAAQYKNRNGLRDRATPPDSDKQGSAAQYKNRNGLRSANSSRKKAADDDQPETGDRRAQMEELLKRGCYECMVCCDNIRQEVAVWNCQKCYHVFHLRCIKQWVKSSLEAEEDIWRCPACQNLNLKPPNGYRCFCGKVKDPKFQPGETPHSCGEVCRRKGKENCTHKCTLLCHPGPCPPCNAVVQRTCGCGAERKSMRCGQITVFKCEKVCGKDLNCGKHQCQVVCHEGDCPPCEVTLQQECYGGHKNREVVCGSEEAILLSFSCKQPCGKTLGCDNHVCEELCHPGECGVCSLLPGQVSHCCCGQTPLSQLTDAPRTSCLDPVPTCEKICSQPMTCGPEDAPHFCPKQCHEGPCGQCEGITELTCVCAANQKEFPCRELDQFTDAEPFKCERRCNKKRMCGRHKCNELCCTRDVHICEVVCGRDLNCGLHKCEQLCHRGNCRPCLQASFEELTCHCGAEVMYPPIACGTKPPPCHRLCTRPHNCSHPVRHACHSDEACPPCTELVHKQCLGEHQLRKNVPCYVQEIPCGRPCGKPLPCGQHKCIKTCHKGPCLEPNETCSQPCGKKRKDCGHPCSTPCHPDVAVCPEIPCRALIEIKCTCGNRTGKVLCQAGSNLSTEIAQFQRLTVQAMASGAPGQELDISQLTVQKKNTSRQLECDSSCALIERNRRMALALEIQNPDLDNKMTGPKFSDFLKESAKKYPTFIAKVEKNLADLVQSAKQSKQPSRSYAFPSMNRDQRRVVHELAEVYGCETQSYDYEPNKNVVATAQRNKCWLPPVTLSASVSQRKAPPPMTKAVAAWGSDKSATSLFKDKEKDKSKDKPEIDYFDFSPK